MKQVVSYWDVCGTAMRLEQVPHFHIEWTGSLRRHLKPIVKEVGTSNISLNSCNARAEQFSDASSGWFDQCTKRTDGSEGLDRVASLVLPQLALFGSNIA